MKYAWIKKHQTIFKISLMCRLLKVSRSQYYKWPEGHLFLQRFQEDKKLSKEIKEIFTVNKGRYGSRRIKQILLKSGYIVSRRRIARLMKEQSLFCKTKRKFKTTTDSRHCLPIANNLLKRDFFSKQANEIYVGDITYIHTEEGWLYLTVVIDIFSRQVVGWSMDKNMTADLVNNALLMAIWKRKAKKGLLWHTDRGSQYASDSHRMLLDKHGIIQSMSRKGNCWDNAVSESFFRTLKVEMIYHESFRTRKEAKDAVFQYIEVYYNRQRIHSYNNYVSPVDYERSQKVA